MSAVDDARDTEMFDRGWFAALVAAERVIKRTAHTKKARECHESTAEAWAVARIRHRRGVGASNAWGFSRRKRAAEAAWVEWSRASLRTDGMTIDFEAGFHMGVGAVRREAETANDLEAGAS